MTRDETAGTPTGAAREYRTAELAEAAGITVRTLRFYRERRLLPPPRREGRIAWYGSHHLSRLRTIAALLDRGHTLSGIADLLMTFESGRGVGELLELQGDALVPWSEETPVRLSPEDLADRFGEQITAANLAASFDIGYLALEGDRMVHVSRRLLDASSALVAEGVPLSAVLAAAREVRTHTEALARIFTDLFRTHVLADILDQAPSTTTAAPPGAEPAAPLSTEELARLGETVERLRPIARAVLDAELSMAMERRIRGELTFWPRERAQPPATGPRTAEEEPRQPRS
ncbi:MerR family transcriptional regulator [Streptomyces sp. TP-A0874]|uniref:MerR family transcriptional regulator n=1 Tax=Streptomyces sp. TP-A0874 TaxID=549819 RepID=UPI00085355A4|nr:MerR family transcriptional regulator [Streptomyces sp. TP-A0874]